MSGIEIIIGIIATSSLVWMLCLISQQRDQINNQRFVITDLKIRLVRWMRCPGCNGMIALRGEYPGAGSCQYCGYTSENGDLEEVDPAEVVFLMQQTQFNDFKKLLQHRENALLFRNKLREHGINFQE